MVAPSVRVGTVTYVTAWGDTAWGTAGLQVMVDRTGTLLGSATLGATVLTDVSGDWVDVTGGLISVETSAGMQIVDGVHLLPETSTITLRSTVDLGEHVGYPAAVGIYGGSIIWAGLIDSSEWETDTDPDADGGTRTVWTITGHGLELLQLQQPIVTARRDAGTRSGSTADFAAPWVPDESSYAAWVESVSGYQTPPETYSGTGPAETYNGWTPGGVVPTAAGYVREYRIQHLLRGCRLDPTQVTNLDQGTQAELLVQMAELVGGRVTSSGEIVPRDWAPVTLTLTDDNVRSASGRIDDTAPQGVSLTSDSRQVVASSGPYRWLERELDPTLLRPSDATWTYTSPYNGTNDPENVAMRKLIMAASMLPIAEPETDGGRYLTRAALDPTRIDTAYPWATPLPWAAEAYLPAALPGLDGQQHVVIGVRHQLTPESWDVDVDLAPGWLLYRFNGRLPMMPRLLGASFDSGVLTLTVRADYRCQVVAVGGPGVFNSAELGPDAATAGIQVYTATPNAGDIATLSIPWGASGVPGALSVMAVGHDRRASAPIECRYGI